MKVYSNAIFEQKGCGIADSGETAAKAKSEDSTPLHCSLDDECRTIIDGSRYSKVVFHVGDSTGYAALQSLQEDNVAVLVVDPIARAVRGIITDLTENRKLGSFFVDDVVLRNTLLSFYNALHADSETTAKLVLNYSQLWEKVQNNTNNLYLVEIGIDQLRFPANFVDEVTYHYPYREETLQSSFIFALNVLKINATFQIATEMTADGQEDLYSKHDYVPILKALVKDHEQEIRVVAIDRVMEPSTPYFSGYDLIFERKHPVLVTITKTEHGTVPTWESEEVRLEYLALKEKRLLTEQEL